MSENKTVDKGRTKGIVQSLLGPDALMSYIH